MVKLIEGLIIRLISGLARGTIIDVPAVKAIMGRSYVVGVVSNRFYGRALGSLARRGIIIPSGIMRSYGGKKQQFTSGK